MSHEPLTINNRLLNELFDYLSCVLDMLAYSNPQIRVPAAPKNPEIMRIEVFGVSHNKTEKLLIQNRIILRSF